MRHSFRPVQRVLLALAGGFTTGVVAFCCGAALAIVRRNPVYYDEADPQLIYVQRQLDHELGSMMFLGIAFGVLSSLYLVVRSRRWGRLLHPVRLRDAALVGFLNIVGIMALSVLAYFLGRGYISPTLGIVLHVASALLVNVFVYERRFRKFESE